MKSAEGEMGWEDKQNTEYLQEKVKTREDISNKKTALQRFCN